MFHARWMAHAYNLSPRESRTWTEWNPVFKLTNTVKAKNQNINKQNIFLFKLIFQGGLLGKQILRFECRKCVNIFRSISGGVKVARLQRGSQTVKTVELVYADIREPYWLVPEQSLAQGGGVTCVWGSALFAPGDYYRGIQSWVLTDFSCSWKNKVGSWPDTTNLTKWFREINVRANSLNFLGTGNTSCQWDVSLACVGDHGSSATKYESKHLRDTLRGKDGLRSVFKTPFISFYLCVCE